MLLVRWVVLSGRMSDLRSRIDELASKQAQGNDELIASLIRRVHALEKTASQAPPVIQVQQPVREVNLSELSPISQEPVPADEVLPPQPKPLPIEPEIVRAPSFATLGSTLGQPIASESQSVDLQERLRSKMGGQEWEALVGGSWLNKLGVLVLVIGIALLLSYSFTQTGPAGRVAIGLFVSFVMLGAGVGIERREGYLVFARGLIGGGWAALYFTTFAMHAIPAARVLENAYVASALLLVVAAGMIVHSLRYRSQTVTGLAYFVAFATLALSEVTPFAVFALIPLAGSLLFAAYRFSWFAMALFGLFATYGTLISRGDAGASLGSTQAIFAAYWLLFEVFDLMRTTRRDEDTTLTKFILPVNAGAFLLLSWRKWEAAAPARAWVFFACAGAAYLVSTLLRVMVRPPSSFNDETETLERAALGGYEGPITISALLAGIAIFLRAPTVWINAGLLIEGEILFLSGLRSGQRYLRWLAAAAFGVSLAKLGFVDVPASGTAAIANLQVKVWTPVALAHAGAFYLNRLLRKLDSGYSWAAAVVVVAVATAEVPAQYISVAYLVFAALLFELGIRTRLSEFRYQAYSIGLLGAVAGLIVNVIGADLAWSHQWVAIAIDALISYSAAIRVRTSQPDRIEDWEVAALRRGGSAAATVFAVALVWKLAPDDYLGLAWIALSALLLELGLRGLPPEFRWGSYAVSGIGVGRLLLLGVFQIHKYAGVPVRISLAGAALICYAIAVRLFRSIPRQIPDRERAWVRDCHSIAATTFLLTAGWVVLPDAVVAVGWAVLGLVLIEVGFATSLASLRLQGNLIAKLVFFRLFFANFTDLGHTGWFSHRLLTVLPIIVSEYYIWWRYQQAEISPAERSATRLNLYAPAILAVVLSRFEMGRALTVTGWAAITLALYVAGLRAKNMDLRWQSYGVAILMFWRCWNTNFYIPESLAGLPGRLLTGSIVVASLYAAQFVSPRPSLGTVRNVFAWLDQHARLLFSSLASTLLAVMLYYEVSGGMLTVAWTAQAMAMLVAGFPLRDRPLRLTGLLLFMTCILKVFLWDLRHLETLQRIMSFIVLGVILVGVSWMYTRFRDRIQRFL